MSAIKTFVVAVLAAAGMTTAHAQHRSVNANDAYCAGLSWGLAQYYLDQGAINAVDYYTSQGQQWLRGADLRQRPDLARNVALGQRTIATMLNGRNLSGAQDMVNRCANSLG